MRHLLKLLLLVFVAIAPVTSATAAARKTARKAPARAAGTRSAKNSTANKRKRTEPVSGYTSKSGKRVAPYKRRSATH
jgi:hypothetical protein